MMVTMKTETERQAVRGMEPRLPRATGGLWRHMLGTESCSKKGRGLGIAAGAFAEIQRSRAWGKDWQAEPGAGGEGRGGPRGARPGRASAVMKPEAPARASPARAPPGRGRKAGGWPRSPPSPPSVTFARLRGTDAAGAVCRPLGLSRTCLTTGGKRKGTAAAHALGPRVNRAGFCPASRLPHPQVPDPWRGARESRPLWDVRHRVALFTMGLTPS